jgi:hypothetical protein
MPFGQVTFFFCEFQRCIQYLQDMESYGMMFDMVNWKEFWMKWSWPKRIIRTFAYRYSGEPQKIQDSWCPGCDSKQTLFEYSQIY